MSENIQNDDFVARLKSYFDTMVVYKDLNKNSFISSFKLPSFMRDYILKRFQDDDGVVDVDEAVEFIRTFLPHKNDWNALQNRMVNQGETIKILAKLGIDISIAKGETSFRLPDYGLGSKDTVIPRRLMESIGEELVKSEERWGVIELCYIAPEDGDGKGKIQLMDFKDFCPYDVDLDEYKDARRQFTLDEWIDVILGGVDYNALGYSDKAQKLAVIQRLLPFVEKRVNLLELAPPGTGKTYLFGNISRYGWLVTGKVSRAKLIYDVAKKQDGIVAMRDFVALDEIREADYLEEPELQAAFQGFLENGKYRATDNHEVNIDASIIFLGNIESSLMDEYKNMMVELPKPFRQSQFLDRIHGFIKGWELPRMDDDLKAKGWALNSEYFSSIMHELREDPMYRAIVDELVVMPEKADTRDSEAIRRLSTAYLKLLFPHVRQPRDISKREFEMYCLGPAMNMRSIIRTQMGIVDEGLRGSDLPQCRVRDFGADSDA